MNRITRIAALALSFAAVGSAFAETPDFPAAQASLSIASRAQVQSEVLQARAAGTLTLGEAQLNRNDTATSLRSRAEVRAETLAAMASGELHALNSDSNDFAVRLQPAKRASVTTQLARADN